MAAAQEEPEEAGSDDEVVATEQDSAGKKKKRRNKKKGTAAAGDGAGADAEAQENSAVVADGPASAAPAVAANAGDDGSGGEEEEEAAEGTTSKKKKKKKKKGTAAAEQEGESEAATAGATAGGYPDASAAPSAPVAAAAEEGDDGDDSGGEEEGAPEGGAAKKKKKKKKKAASTALVPVVAGGVQGVTKYCVDEEFERWSKAALEATLVEQHKLSQEERMKPPQPFWGYKYSGDLRPALVTPRMRMPSEINTPDYAHHPDGVSESERNGPKEVPVLEGKELQTMREACRLGREVLDIAARFMKAGVTGDEIDRIVYQACVDRKIYPSPLNYYRFPKSVCVSPNEVICHGIPDCRPIEEGDVVNLDVSIYHQGFHADLNETFFIGECDEDAHRVVRTAYNALHAAAQEIRPGTFYRDLGNIIHQEAVKGQCAVVTTYCGHGIGRLFHGPPKVPHYRKNKAVGIMKPGHIFTIEPMINLGNDGGDRTWPDNWTAVTKNGKRSAQFEHTFLVTEKGYEILTMRHGTSPTSMPAYDKAMFQV